MGNFKTFLLLEFKYFPCFFYLKLWFFKILYYPDLDFRNLAYLETHLSIIFFYLKWCLLPNPPIVWLAKTCWTPTPSSVSRNVASFRATSRRFASFRVRRRKNLDCDAIGDADEPFRSNETDGEYRTSRNIILRHFRQIGVKLKCWWRKIWRK